jgi:hypothetical protein
MSDQILQEQIDLSKLEPIPFKSMLTVMNEYVLNNLDFINKCLVIGYIECLGSVTATRTNSMKWSSLWMRLSAKYSCWSRSWTRFHLRFLTPWLRLQHNLNMINSSLYLLHQHLKSLIRWKAHRISVRLQLMNQASSLRPRQRTNQTVAS